MGAPQKAKRVARVTRARARAPVVPLRAVFAGRAPRALARAGAVVRAPLWLVAPRLFRHARAAFVVAFRSCSFRVVFALRVSFRRVGPACLRVAASAPVPLLSLRMACCFRRARVAALVGCAPFLPAPPWGCRLGLGSVCCALFVFCVALFLQFFKCACSVCFCSFLALY